MLNQKGASRMDTVVKLALVFIISLLSFSIGTFVGKQFSDQQHKTAMIESQNGQSRSTASIPSDSLEVKPDNALTDADIASITEEFAHAEKDEIDELIAANTKTAENVEIVEETPAKDTAATDKKDSSIEDMMAEMTDEPASGKEEVAAVAEIPTKMPAKTVAPKVEEKKDVTANAAEKIVSKLKPAVKDKKEISRIPTSLPSKIAASTVGKFTIQVAAYQKMKEAKSHALTLTNKGYSAFYVGAKVKGNTWYRVNVGLFANKSKATAYRKRLMKEANLKSALIKKVIK